MENTTGIDTLLTFAPGWSEPELLEKTLVGRRDLVDQLEELAIDGADGPNKYQRLIIGSRGSGKTHVIKVLHNRLWANEEVKKKLLIVYMLEDETGIANFLDFTKSLLLAVQRWYPEKYEWIEKRIDQLPDLPPDVAEDRAVEWLLEIAENKTILILVENLGLLFDEKSGFGKEGQQALRDLVQSHPRFMIFATSQALFIGIQKHDLPFFGFFSTTHLKKLTIEEAKELLTIMADAYGKTELSRFLKTRQGQGRIKAIYSFTGGNHRILVNFFQFLTSDSLSKLSKEFIKGLNPLRPYYQEQIRSITAQQQKIVKHLCLERTPQTVKDIARGCLSTSNVVSRQLKELLDKGFVSREQIGRESYYEIREYLFRIVQEADLEQKGAPIRLFVDFLAGYYSANELDLRRLGYEFLSKTRADADKEAFLHEARFYREALKKCGAECVDCDDNLKPDTLFEKLLNEKAYSEILHFAPHFDVDKNSSILYAEAIAQLELGNIDKAEKKAIQVLDKNPDDFKPHLLLSKIYGLNDIRNPKALKHAQKAFELKPDHPSVVEANGGIAFVSGKHEEALEYFSRLTELRPDYSLGWCLKGFAFHELNRIEAAEEAYIYALKIDPDNTGAIENIGIIRGKSGNPEKALNHFTHLVELRPNYSLGWHYLGDTLFSLERFQEAKKAYIKVLELDTDNTAAIWQIGIINGKLGKYNQALEFFHRLTELIPDNYKSWCHKGFAYESLGNLVEAEKAYHKTLILDPDNAKALERIGFIKGKTGDCEEALKYLVHLTELEPGYSLGWFYQGLTYASLGMLEEAFKAYQKALELDPENAQTIEHIGLIELNTEKHEEALMHFIHLIDLKPDYYKGWDLKGDALFKLRRIGEAEKAYISALKLDPENYIALNAIGEIKRYQKEYMKALEFYEKSLKINPDGILPIFNTSSALVALGRFDEALENLEMALNVVTENPKNKEVNMTVQSLHENLMELFEQASTAAFAGYLQPAIDIIEKYGFLEELGQGVGLNVFELLRRHEDISEKRFEKIVEVLENILADRVEISVPLKFLRTGIDYFVKKNKKALMALPGEERKLFMEELNIESK